MKGKGKLYVEFVDFKKAFDTVDKRLVMKRLKKMGVDEYMYKMIETIYNKATNEVMTEEGISESFESKRCVGKGCPLGPMLFNVLTKDMDDE